MLRSEFSVTLQKAAIFALEETGKIPQIKALGLSRAQLYTCIAEAIQEKFAALPDHIKRNIINELPNGQQGLRHFSPKANRVKEIIPTYYAARTGIGAQQDILLLGIRRLSMTLDPDFRQFMSIFDITLEDVKRQAAQLDSKD